MFSDDQSANRLNRPVNVVFGTHENSVVKRMIVLADCQCFVVIRLKSYAQSRMLIGFIDMFYIRITDPCNVYPLTPHFNIVKLGFTGVYFFLIFAPKH